MIKISELATIYAEMNVFCTIVECASFSKAAIQLDIAQSTVSKKLKYLEDFLGYILISRNTRNLEVTPQGKRLYEFFIEQQKIFTAYIDTQKNLNSEIYGRVRIVLPELFSYNMISPKIATFMQNNPNLILEVYYQSKEINLLKDKYDLAVLNHMPKQNPVSIKYLGSQRFGLYCTPEYIQRYGMLENINDLSKHLYTAPINYDHTLINQLHSFSQTYGEHLLEHNTRLYSSSAMQGRQIALSHDAIIGCFEEFLSDDLKKGQFVRLLPDYEFHEISYYLTWLPNNTRPEVQLVSQFLQECCQSLIKHK